MSRAVWGLFQIKLGSLPGDAPTERPENLSHVQEHQPHVSELLQLAQADSAPTNTLSKCAPHGSRPSGVVRDLGSRLLMGTAEHPRTQADETTDETATQGRASCPCSHLGGVIKGFMRCPVR